MTMTLLPWLILAPTLAALLAPSIGALVPSWRSPLYTLSHVGALVLALLALAGGSGSVAVLIQRGPLALQLGLALDRSSGLALVVAAAIFLAVGWFSQGYARGARYAGAFRSLLLLEQAAVSLALLASDLLALYAGLLTLSLSMMLMIGLDFGPSGGAAALRTFATVEVPAALAFAGFWLIDAHAGTLALSDLARETVWLRGSASPALVAAIAIALIGRAGLTPLHNWVVAGCRAASATAAIAIAGIALPVGGLVLGRLVDLAIPLGTTATEGLALLGAATAIVAGIGATRERNALAWLGYLAVGQVGLTVVGFVAGGSAGQLSASLGLAATALAITLIGMAVGLAIRAAGRDQIDSFARLSRVPAARLPFLIGMAALVPLPPLPTFVARRLLLASLLSSGSIRGYGIAAMVVLGTLALALPIWRVALTPEPSPAQWGRGLGMRALIPGAKQQELTVPMIALAGAIVLLGLMPASWLIGPVATAWSGVSAALVILAVGAAVVVGPAMLGSARLERLNRSLSRLGGRARLDLALDPYVLVGGLLLAVGRLSAITLDETLGRLARAR
ncbi:MAG: proton-conducting transporter membrane subunit [Chloroflexota bacterium]